MKMLCHLCTCNSLRVAGQTVMKCDVGRILWKVLKPFSFISDILKVTFHEVWSVFLHAYSA